MIIVDTDFLSSFSKIGRLDLVFGLFECRSLVVPRAVLEEIRGTDFFKPYLGRIAFSDEDVTRKKDMLVRGATSRFDATVLGKGEREAISLAMGSPGSVLLMNDRPARLLARKNGVLAVGISTFLKLCKTVGICTEDEIAVIIDELKEMDHYEFSNEELGHLLPSKNADKN